MQLDRGDHIIFTKPYYAAVRENFNPPLCDFRIDSQFPGDGGKVLLQDLQGDESRITASVVREQSNGLCLLDWRAGIIGVDQNIRVEEGGFPSSTLM